MINAPHKCTRDTLNVCMGAQNVNEIYRLIYYCVHMNVSRARVASECGLCVLWRSAAPQNSTTMKLGGRGRCCCFCRCRRRQFRRHNQWWFIFII